MQSLDKKDSDLLVLKASFESPNNVDQVINSSQSLQSTPAEPTHRVVWTMRVPHHQACVQGSVSPPRLNHHGSGQALHGEVDVVIATIDLMAHMSARSAGVVRVFVGTFDVVKCLTGGVYPL